jgi:NADPH:quinone reductase-like Zn-dependent oxidoreductase
VIRRLTVWGRGSFGADHMFRPRRFWREFRADLTQLVDLLAQGKLAPQIARRVPFRDAASALMAHRAGGFTGKIVLEAGAASAKPDHS